MAEGGRTVEEASIDSASLIPVQPFFFFLVAGKNGEILSDGLIWVVVS